MSTDIASLSVEIDSTPVQTLKERQDQATASGEKLEEQMYSVQGRMVSLGEAVRMINAERLKETEASQRQTEALAFQDRQIQQILGRYDPLGAKMRALLADQERLRQSLGNSVNPSVMKAFQGLEDEISQIDALMKEAGVTATDTGAKTEAAGYHMGLGSAHARRELIILGREAMEGNFARIPATMLTLAAHTGLFSSALIALTGAVASVAIPLAIFIKLQVDIEKTNESIGKTQALFAASGRAALESSSQIAKYSEELRKAGGVSEEESFKIIDSLAKQGAISADLFSKLVKVVPDFARAIGEDLPTAADKLAKSFGEPLTGVLSLDKELNFLTLQEYKTIEAMKQHSDTAGIQAIAIEALKRRVDGLRAETLTPLQRAWEELKNTWRGTDEPDRQSTAMANLAKNLSLLADVIRTVRSAWQGFTGFLGGMALGGGAGSDKYMAQQAQAEKDRKDHAQFVQDLAAQDARANEGALERQRHLKEIYELQQKIAASDIENSVKIHDIQAKEQTDHEDALLKLEQITQKQHDDEVYRIQKEKLEYQLAAEKRLSGLATLSVEQQHQHVLEMARIKEELDALAKGKADKDAVRTFEESQDAMDEASKSGKFMDDTLTKLGFTINGIVAGIDSETASLGLSSREKRVNTELAKIQNDLAEKGIYLSAQTVAGIRAEIEAHLALQAVQVESVAMWTKVSSIAGNFFADLILNGKSAFKKLGDEVKAFAAQILALFAQRYVLQMVAGLTGNSALSAVAGGLGQGSAASGVLNALGLGSSVSGLSTGAASGSFAASIFGTGGSFASMLGDTAVGVAESLGVAGEAAAAFGEAVAAAVPVIGWIAAAGMIAYSLFGNKGGGPKTQGAGGVSFDANGNPTNLSAAAAQRLVDINGDNQNAAASTAASLGLGQAYFSALQALGGSSGGITFGLGVSQDTRGSAPSFVHTDVLNAAGQSIFSQRNNQVGRDDASVQAEVALQGQRAILAALQQSDLPEAIKSILGLVDATTATSDQITNIEKLASAFKAMTDTLTHVDLDTLLKNAHASATDQISTQTTALLKLAASTKLTTDGITTLSNATAAYKNQVAQTILQIEQVKDSLTDMFSGTKRTIQMAGLSDQDRYNFLQKESADLLTQALNSNDPAQIQKWSNQINDDINQAFSMLSPEQQASMKDDFLSRLDSANDKLRDHLTEIQKGLTDQLNTTLDKIKDTMETAANTQAAAANTMNNAATTIADNNPTRLQVTVDVENGTAVVSSGG